VPPTSCRSESFSQPASLAAEIQSRPWSRIASRRAAAPRQGGSEDLHERVGGRQDIGILVGQAHVQPDDFPEVGVPGPKGRGQGRHGHQAADVDVADAAVDRLAAGGEVREEVAVILLQVGVAVPARLEHERHVAVEPLLGVVAAVVANHGKQLGGQPEVKRVLPGRKELVVVDAPLAPEGRLLAEDVELRARRRPLAPPEDAAGVRVAGGEVGRCGNGRGQLGIVAIERCRVVIPMDRHGHGVGHERGQEGGRGRG